MGLRDIVASDRRHILTSPDYGLGEATQWLPHNSAPVDILATWTDTPMDKMQTHDLADAQFSATVVEVALADVPGITRADQFRRQATGIVWSIEELVLITGVGYRIHLTRSANKTL